jgi:hypothetical protein
MKCLICGKENPDTNEYCDDCGVELLSSVSAAPVPSVQLSEIECQGCKQINPPGTAFCDQCGASLSQTNQSSQTQPPIPPPPPKLKNSVVLPDGAEIAIEAKKEFGRLDLAKFAGPSEAMWMSRSHFVVFEENGVPYIQDQGSTNGTKLNNKEIKLQGKQQLKDGDEIVVADAVKLLFKSQIMSA